MTSLYDNTQTAVLATALTAAKEGTKLYNGSQCRLKKQTKQNNKETVDAGMKQQDSPLCDGSLLSATFLSAEAMASEGTRGLSTYLGFRIGPAGMNHRHGGE